MSLLKYANHNIPQTKEQRQEIVQNAAKAYENFMDALKIDWRNDPNSKDTPLRVAKSFVNELIIGCYSEEPKITAFENIDKYDGIVFSGEIPVISLCSHHHLSFSGFAYCAYIPSKDGKIIGLSKLSRICEFYSRRPQVQENLTMQIFEHINKVCEGNLGVAVYISAKHSCCGTRGVKNNSIMKTSKLSGYFFDWIHTRNEFFHLIGQNG
jgi:GTP cyclohydrolase IA